jgi:hypothetical protein
MSKLEEAKARLDAQAAEAQEARDDQEATDLEALYEAKIEHGLEAVVAVAVPHTPGLPLMAIVRRPKPIEHKRFTDLVSKKDAASPEYMKAAEQLAAICLVYPEKEVYAKMCDAFPGLKVPLGVAAANLAAGKAREDAK